MTVKVSYGNFGDVDATLTLTRRDGDFDATVTVTLR